MTINLMRSLEALFYDKAVTFASEAMSFAKKGFRRIDNDLAIIVIHQAIEMGMKAKLLHDGGDIYEKPPRTLGFKKALNKITRIPNNYSTQLLTLNDLSNNLKHTAILSLPEYNGFLVDFIDELIIIMDSILPKHPKKGKKFKILINIENGTSQITYGHEVDEVSNIETD